MGKSNSVCLSKMKKVLCSFGFGEHSKLLRLSTPTLYTYAQNHNYDLFLPNIDYFSSDTKTRHPSWWKIELISNLFREYDQVLWIDADVIICRFEHDIFTEVISEHDMGVVVHQTNDGYVPNCGVWALNKSCTKWLNSLWNYNSFHRSRCWWEQAAMLYLLGVDPDKTYIDTPPSQDNISWTALDYLWNPHINDSRGIPQETRFFHATSFQDRYAVMKHILRQIEL